MANYLTTDLPGIGGEIRKRIDDFFVEEIPLYQPCGSGDHLYLTLEKRNLTTFGLLDKIARQLGYSARDIGYAGLKDARAVTRQTISLPIKNASNVEQLDIPGVKVLAVSQHKNKLRPGHLAGNRFRIRISHPVPEALNRSRAILEALKCFGVPNRFGEQRYGVLNNSDRIGRAILIGDYVSAMNEIIGCPEKITDLRWQASAAAFRAADLDSALDLLPEHCQNERRLLTVLKESGSPGQAVLAMPRKLLRLYLSAYQSRLFDYLVDTRLSAIGELWLGDLAYVHHSGACFAVCNPTAEQARADKLEISPSAPLFGHKVRIAGGEARVVELQLLETEGLILKNFRLPKGLSMEGERRPIRVPLVAPQAEADADGIWLSFSLPKGSFATTVLGEVMKPAI
ncbi:MAG: tRNA pseudouridine(13) synthase TruD [Deltaproteobacteria bacterium]|jgi:tRNA pseudouridine13 synthase|nr:tRNA pseudouridine(13) synthase TruD [Deltaproteobacteria bacterium]